MAGVLSFSRALPIATGSTGSCRCRCTVRRLRSGALTKRSLWPAEGAQRINAPVLDKLKVVRRTRDQGSSSPLARWANVAGAFTSRGPVAGRSLLVDDVFTTGATLSDCARVLRKAGAGEIHALTPCRTV